MVSSSANRWKDIFSFLDEVLLHKICYRLLCTSLYTPSIHDILYIIHINVTQTPIISRLFQTFTFMVKPIMHMTLITQRDYRTLGTLTLVGFQNTKCTPYNRNIVAIWSSHVHCITLHISALTTPHISSVIKLLPKNRLTSLLRLILGLYTFTDPNEMHEISL